MHSLYILIHDYYIVFMLKTTFFLKRSHFLGSGKLKNVLCCRVSTLQKREFETVSIVEIKNAILTVVIWCVNENCSICILGPVTKYKQL